MFDLYLPHLIVFIFSIIQSIFGVGLLLFGTPTLLLLGYSYEVTLWTLLPASITISIIQIVRGYIYIKVNKEVYFFTIPALIAGLTFVIAQEESIDISKIVGVMLLLIGAIRYSSFLQNAMKSFIDKNIRFYFMMMGLVHGISNMGGGPLSVLMASLYNEKYTIRTNIAFVYFVFGISQLAVLAYMNSTGAQYVSVWFLVIAFLSYLTVGRYLVRFINDGHYQELITLVIVMYGVLSFV